MGGFLSHVLAPAQTIVVPSTWDELLDKAMSKLGLGSIGNVYLANGSLIDEIDAVDAGDALYFSAGKQPFLVITGAAAASPAAPAASKQASAPPVDDAVAAEAARQAQHLAMLQSKGKLPAPTVVIPTAHTPAAVPLDATVRAQEQQLNAHAQARPPPAGGSAAGSSSAVGLPAHGSAPPPQSPRTIDLDLDTVVAIIDGKYDRSTVQLVMRHFAGSADSLINRLLTGINVEEYLAMDRMLTEAARSPPRVKTCGICLTEFSVEEMFTIDCEGAHRMCFGCVRSMVDMAIREGQPVTCPECPHAFTDLEIVQVVGEGEALEKFRAQQLQRALNNLEGAIACPTPDCKGYEVASQPGQRERVECSICHKVFCSLCRENYHPKIECAEFKSKEALWLAWLATGRDAYVNQLSAVDREYEARLNTFEQERHKHMQAVKDAQRRLKEHADDEEWKAQNCRCCPSCHRLINKVSGCDSMVCGRNYHGGDEQDGCGASFNWQTAPPYAPANPAHVPTVEPMREHQPEHGMRVTHALVQGAGEAAVLVRCDICQQEIFGPEFTCVNCPQLFSVCLRCQPRVHLFGHNGHVFDIIYDDREAGGERTGAHVDPAHAGAAGV